MSHVTLAFCRLWLSCYSHSIIHAWLLSRSFSLAFSGCVWLLSPSLSLALCPVCCGVNYDHSALQHYNIDCNTHTRSSTRVKMIVGTLSIKQSPLPPILKGGKRFSCLHLCTALRVPLCVALRVALRVALHVSPSLVFFAAFGSNQSFLLLPLFKGWEEVWLRRFRLIRIAIRRVRLLQCAVRSVM